MVASMNLQRQLRGMVMVELPDKGGIESKTPDYIKAFLTLDA